MDEIVVAVSISMAAVLLIVDIVFDVIMYYKRQKLIEELIAAHREEDDEDPDVQEDISELEESREDPEENEVCNSCRCFGRCDPLAMADAVENGCEKRKEK